jgi:hypothetical protein
MSQFTSEMADRVLAAIEPAVRLIGEANDPADPVETADLIGRLTNALAALPPAPSNDCFYRNSTTAVERLMATGEYKAARLQLLFLVRKLRSDLRAWQAVARRPVTAAHPSR